MTLLSKIKKIYYTKFLKRKYYRTGKCLKCGACCKNIYVRHKNDIIKTQDEFELIKKNCDYKFYHQIEVIGKDDFGLIFSCTKYDEKNKLCKDHKNRPSICRNYPREEIFMMRAQLQDGCGYSFEPIERFSEVFDKIKKRPVKDFEIFCE